MTTIDEALTLLAGTGPEYAGGFSNHGPMAAEALFTLGRPGAVIPWVTRYKARLQEAPDTRKSLRPDELTAALGDGRRVGNWIAFFDRALALAPWRTVVSEWIPRLAPGLMAAAAHGVIRTAHAVRSLAAEETPPRRYELAQGLGYWASRYRALPGSPSGRGGGRRASVALAHVARVHDESYVARGSIDEALRGLDQQPAFAQVVNLVDPTGDLSRFLSDLTAAFAAVYLANPRVPIVFVHSVTAPSTLRILAPYLEENDRQLATRYAWQGCGALYAWYAAVPFQAPADRAEAPAPGDLQDLIDRAVATGDEHAIKFTDACLREYALSPQAVFLAAAYDATERLRAT